MTTIEERLSTQRAKLRWCVHMLGPDEMVPMVSYEEAEKYASIMNHALHGGERAMPDVLCLAHVVPWLRSREEHEKGLKEHAEIERQHTFGAGEMTRHE